MREWLSILLCCIGLHRPKYADRPRLIQNIIRYECERCGLEMWEQR
jgi:hypothetical protein